MSVRWALLNGRFTVAAVLVLALWDVTWAQAPDAIKRRVEEAQRGFAAAVSSAGARGRFLERFPGNYAFAPENAGWPVATVLNPSLVGTLAVGPVVDVNGTYNPRNGGLEVRDYALAASQRQAPDVPGAGSASVTEAFAAANNLVSRLKTATAPGAMSVERRSVDPDSPLGRDILRNIRDYARAYRSALDKDDKTAAEEIVRRWAEVRTTITDTLPDGSEFKAVYQYLDLYPPWRYERIYRDTSSVVAIADRNGSALCSGAVIAEDLVLTAGHCFSGPPRRLPREVEVWFDYIELADGMRKPLSRREVAPDPVAPSADQWNRLLEGPFTHDLYDYAIIRIKPPSPGVSPLPRGVLPLCLRRTPPDRLDAVYVVGFPQGKPATVHDHGRVELPYRVAKGTDFDLLRLQVDTDFRDKQDREKVLKEFDDSYALDSSNPIQAYYFFSMSAT